MEQDAQHKDAQGLPERLFGFAALLGGLTLFAIMLLVTVAVFFRYVLNQPILGNQEFVEIGMVFVVMLAMPHTALTGQHIRVDILDHLLGDAGRFLADLFARGIGVFVLFLLVRKSYSKKLDAREYEDVTNMIELPIWWAYGAIVAGMGLFALVLVLQIYRQIRQGVQGYE